MDETPPAPPHAPPHAPPGNRRIVREPDDRKIAGVCSGLADHLGIDVTVMRVVAVVLALVTPAALIAYLVASVALPERPPDQPRVRAQNVHLGQVPHPLIAVGAIVAVAVLVDDAWWLDPFPAAVALVGIGVWLVLSNREDTSPQGASPPAGATPVDTPPADAPTAGASAAGTPPVDEPTTQHPMASSPWLVSVSQHSDTVGDRSTTLTDEQAADLSDQPSRQDAGPSGEFPPPASPWWSGHPAAAPAPAPPAATVPCAPRRSRAGSVVVALLLIGAGALWLLAGVDMVELDADEVLAVGLLVIGAGLVVTAWRGRGYALIPLGFVLIGTLVAGEVIDIPLGAGVGDRTVIVDSADEMATRHELFAGDLTVDLRDARLPAGRTTEIEAAVGAGDLTVIVPRDVAVDVRASTQGGKVSSPGGPEANETGLGVDTSFTLDPVRSAGVDPADPTDPTDPPGPAEDSDPVRSDPPRLALDLSVGVGALEVTRG